MKRVVLLFFILSILVISCNNKDKVTDPSNSVENVDNKKEFPSNIKLKENMKNITVEENGSGTKILFTFDDDIDLKKELGDDVKCSIEYNVRFNTSTVDDKKVTSYFHSNLNDLSITVVKELNNTLPEKGLQVDVQVKLKIESEKYKTGILPFYIRVINK